jgi:DNA-binding transcriptional LysR family regulator
MAFGVRWVAPILPDFFRLYPDIAVDLHLSDNKVDMTRASTRRCASLFSLPGNSRPSGAL